MKHHNPPERPSAKSELLNRLVQYEETPRRAHERIHQANPRVLYGLRRYFLVGGNVGHFLEQLLSNNFVGTVGRADNNVMMVLDSLSTYLHMYPPADSWGSKALVKEWQKRGGYVDMHGPAEAWQRLQSDPL